jgi:hypothetical protein
MKKITAPSITPQAAFQLLETNNFSEVEIDATTSVIIEPGTENQFENMLAFVTAKSSGFLNTFSPHASKQRWSFLT